MAQIEARCLANGKQCKSNGSMGSCCSGFCLAQGNVSLLHESRLF